MNVEHAQLLPPDVLYHGTAIHHLDSIRKDGLVPGASHHVHLSSDETTARAVGARHGKPLVLVVQSGQMSSGGFTFYRAENGVWLTDRVPPEFLS